MKKYILSLALVLAAASSFGVNYHGRFFDTNGVELTPTPSGIVSNGQNYPFFELGFRATNSTDGSWVDFGTLEGQAAIQLNVGDVTSTLSMTTNGTLYVNGTPVGTPAGVVTISYGETNIIALPDYSKIYCTGSTNSLVNTVYDWAGSDNTNGIDWNGWSGLTNGLGSQYHLSQIFQRAFTNANGFAVFLNEGSDGICGDIGTDFVLTKGTDIDWVNWTNLCYVNGRQVYKTDNTAFSQTYPNLTTNWNSTLSDVQYDDPPWSLMYGPPYPTFAWGTNYITNTPAFINYGNTNRTIFVDAVCGNDSSGTIGDARHPFQTIQAAQAISELVGENLEWHIAEGNYHLLDYVWCPSNAVIYASPNAVVYDQDAKIAFVFSPFGTCELHGGKIYQQLGRGIFGPVGYYNAKATEYRFYNTKIFAEHGALQGYRSAIQPTLPLYVIGCEIWSGSYALEMQGGISNRIELQLKDTIIHENSWNPNSSGTGLFPVALQYCDAFITGCTFLVSNGYDLSYSGGCAGIKDLATATNSLYLSATVMQFTGSNTNWQYLNLNSNSTHYWFGTRYNTNRIVGPIPADSP